MSTNARIRVLIADDHPVARRGLVALLADDAGFEVIGEARTGAEAIAKHRRTAPDVVVMDLRMPELDGVEATYAIANGRPPGKVLVLSSYDTEGDLQRARQAGAKGYLPKESDPDEVLDAIRKVAAGGTYLPNHLQQRLVDAAWGDLKIRDLKLLALMQAGQSNREIASALGLTEGTVRVYLTGLFVRLGVKNRTEAVSVAITSGLVVDRLRSSA